MAARTTALVIGGIAVLAAAAVLVVQLAASPNEPKAEVPVAKPTAGSGSATPARPPSIVVTDVPRGEGAGGTPVTNDGEHPRDYAVGDAHVRDHRSGDQKPIDLPPNVHPADSRLIPSTLTHDISQKVKAVMKDCVASLPKEGRGEKPHVEGTLTIAIKAKTLSVTQSAIQLRDLDGIDAQIADTTKQCIESHAIGLTTPATDQADLDSYTIHVTFAVP